MRPNLKPPRTANALQARVDEYANKTDGRLGVFVGIPTENGFDTIASHSSEAVFASASLIKLPILYALFDEYWDSKSRLAQEVGLSDTNMVAGSGLLHLLSEHPYTLDDLARAMIAISDNAATNQLIDTLGMERIERAVSDLGMSETRLGRKMMTTGGGSDSSNLEESPVNTTSPRDAARFYRNVVRRESLSVPAYESLEVPLYAQKDASMAARYLPYDVELGHKTGWLTHAALDAGVLHCRDGEPIVFALFVDRLAYAGDGTDIIAELGLAIHGWSPNDCGL
ncbi:hypothetical protein AUR64_04190 [Haloprofundus marisrubri]|uniref:Beta-lactamase class A catalytic domain-containing protein n=1 Tax=Haloprofundus marisrubri TaxID=1514971 RepID=A0A0W1RCN0_9EURY|nr:serine hydrolase [Haloprofundus marisrubri]KTG11461.1 hypothetical protein AUR64_04190 [Haloprofundus marisrubri]